LSQPPGEEGARVVNYLADDEIPLNPTDPKSDARKSTRLNGNCQALINGRDGYFAAKAVEKGPSWLLITESSAL
jgi:hypothetical protein